MSLLHLTAHRKALLKATSPHLNHPASGGGLLYAATARLADKKHFHLSFSQTKTKTQDRLLNPFLISHESGPSSLVAA